MFPEGLLSYYSDKTVILAIVPAGDALRYRTVFGCTQDMYPLMHAANDGLTLAAGIGCHGFPVSAGAFTNNPTPGQSRQQIAVARLSVDGKTMPFSTVIGGSGSQYLEELHREMGINQNGSRSELVEDELASLVDRIRLEIDGQLPLLTPMSEVVEAMNELVDEGKVRYLGCSNFAAWELADAHWTAREAGRRPFVSAQNEYSLYNRVAEQELVPACERFGVGLLPYFPLAYGLLTGKYRRGEAAPEGSRLGHEGQAHRLRDADFDRVEALEAYAAERGLDILTVALGGLAAQPAVASVIAGATRPEQIASNVEAGLWEPTSDDLEALREVNRLPAPGMTYTSLLPSYET